MPCLGYTRTALDIAGKSFALLENIASACSSRPTTATSAPLAARAAAVAAPIPATRP